MGEVYRARDTRLDRIVAIKVLPEGFAADSDRVRRFEQESRNVAALNHPNVMAVYDVGAHDGLRYLVTEFLEGETLRQRLDEGMLPLRKTIEIALQVARGLTAAHEHNIVHRDLKPDNIFLSKDGQAKLLDFGLAKARAAGGGSDVTLASSQTSPGVVLGTAGYMAPEQVRGEAADHRADIFSFGAVLYEMLGGKRAFNGDSAVEIMTAILKSEPPEFDAAAKIPPGVDRIVRHCLEKNPDDRFQTARDLTFALGALSGTDSSVATEALALKRQPRWTLWAAGALALVAVASLAASFLRSGKQAHRMEFAIPVQGEISYLALSADGEMLAYVSPDENSGQGVLYVQPLGSPTATRVDGTEGATYPFWSPDHKYVVFFSGSTMKKVALSGGVPQVITKVTEARGGAWGSKDVIVYTPDSGGFLWRINADGTQAAPLTDKLSTPTDASHRFPVFLPDGEHFLFWGGNFDELPDDKASGIYVSSLDGKKRDLVALARSSVGYANGSVFYLNDQNALVAVPIDSAGKAVGQPKVIANVVGRYPSTYWGDFSVASNGTIVYGLGTGAPVSQLTWYDRGGKEIGKVGDPGILANPTISPGGKFVTVDVIDLKSKNIDVWIENLARGTMSRFTFDPSEETTGVWSRDGSMIAFRSASTRRLLVKKAFGLEPERVVYKGASSGDSLPNAWTLDGKQVLVTSKPPTGRSQLDLIAMDGRSTPLISGQGSATNGQISPDGKWVVYSSDASGDWEIYATTFPTAGGKLQISRGGGTEPRWRGDGMEIFYLGPRGMLTAVALDTTGGTLTTSAPQPLFSIRGRAPISSTDLFTYDVTKDGQKFLVNRYVKPLHIDPMNIVLNATEQTP
jgi:Tol biopolymer transport system component